MTACIHVGSIVDKQSLDPLTDAIIRIMCVDTTPKTIRAGLEALTKLGSASAAAPVNISNCNIGMPASEKADDDIQT